VIWVTFTFILRFQPHSGIYISLLYIYIKFILVLLCWASGWIAHITPPEARKYGLVSGKICPLSSLKVYNWNEIHNIWKCTSIVRLFHFWYKNDISLWYNNQKALETNPTSYIAGSFGSYLIGKTAEARILQEYENYLHTLMPLWHKHRNVFVLDSLLLSLKTLTIHQQNIYATLLARDSQSLCNLLSHLHQKQSECR